jgi:predicted GNAT family N-acyltransferase
MTALFLYFYTLILLHFYTSTLNNTHICSFPGSDSKLLSTALEIRTIVFIEGQNVPSELEHDGLENESTHYLLYVEEQAVGTARLRITEKGIKLERFAILEAHRNKGYGEIILKKVLEDARIHGDHIYLHAQADAVNFYLRNGFKITSSPFSEAGIIHYIMIYDSSTLM